MYAKQNNLFPYLNIFQYDQKIHLVLNLCGLLMTSRNPPSRNPIPEIRVIPLYIFL